MSNFELPLSMEPVTDPRVLAAELSYTYFLMQCREGSVSEQDETRYVRPTMQDFPLERAAGMVGDFVSWYLENSEDGLVGTTELDPTKGLLEELAETVHGLQGVSKAIIQQHDLRLKSHEMSVRLLRNNMGEDAPAHPDENVIFLARLVCEDFIDPQKEGIKEALMRTRNPAIYEKLGAILRAGRQSY